MPGLAHSRQRAFTLIELLVVVLIVGILLAVAAPSFLGQTDKAYDSVAQQELTIAWKTARSTYTSDGRFPSDSNGSLPDGSDGSLETEMHASEPDLQFVHYGLGSTDPSSDQNVSSSPYDISVIDDSSDGSDGTSTVALCNHSQSGRDFCIRVDIYGALRLAAYEPGGGTQGTGSIFDRLLGVSSARAATLGDQNATFSKATGMSQRDAFCALANNDVPAGSNTPGSCPASSPPTPGCPGVSGWTGSLSCTTNGVPPKSNGTPPPPVIPSVGCDPPDPYSAAVEADNPVAYWRLGCTPQPNGWTEPNEISGTPDMAMDNNGVYGNPAYDIAQVPGPIAEGDNAVELPNWQDNHSYATGQAGQGSVAKQDPALWMTNQYTLEAWVYLDSAHPGGIVLTQVSGSCSPSACEPGYTLSAGSGASSTTAYNVPYWGASISTPKSYPPLSLNQWHYLVATFSGPACSGSCNMYSPPYGTETFYEDGVAIGTDFQPEMLDSTNWDGAVSLGYRSWIDQYGMQRETHFAGGLDEVAIYNYALTPQQIAAHYAAASK